MNMGTNETIGWLAACELRHNRMYEARLAEAVAEDLGEPADSLRPRLVAAAAMAFHDDSLRFLDARLAAPRS